MKFAGHDIAPEYSHNIDEALRLADHNPVRKDDIGRLMPAHRGDSRDDPIIDSWHRHYVELLVPHITVRFRTKGKKHHWSLVLYKERRSTWTRVGGVYAIAEVM